jgi:hypothetical protein
MYTTLHITVSKIELIKLLRTLTNCGLVEAKLAIESYFTEDSDGNTFALRFCKAQKLITMLQEGKINLEEGGQFSILKRVPFDPSEVK